jgi:hypothetical protein
MTTAEIEGDEDGITVQLPPTAGSWELLQEIDAETGVSLTSADGDQFTGNVQDWDDAHYTVTVELR